VVLKDADEVALHRGMDLVRRNYAASVERGRLTQAFVDERLELIRPTLRYEDFSDADIVVEAIFENMAAKKVAFGELDRICNPVRSWRRIPPRWTLTRSHLSRAGPTR